MERNVRHAFESLLLKDRNGAVINFIDDFIIRLFFIIKIFEKSLHTPFRFNFTHKLLASRIS